MENISRWQKEMQKLLAEKIQSQKGLSIIYTINKIISKNNPVEITLLEIVKEIPKAWQFSEYAYARIKYDNREYKPEVFKETRWIQKQIFETYDRKWGAIDLFYTKQFPRADEGPFLHEERQLLENIATILCNYLNSQNSLESVDAPAAEDVRNLESSRRQIEEKNIEETLSQICRNMPKSWKYPEYAVARIVYDGSEYLSSGKSLDNIDCSLRKVFTTIDNKSGKIEIYYLKGFPFENREAYLASEDELINNMANLITGFLNIIKGNEIRQPGERDGSQVSGKAEGSRIFACINEISKRFRNGISIEATLEEMDRLWNEAKFELKE